MNQILFRYTLRRWLFPIGGAVLFFGGLLLAKELVDISKEVFNLGASFKWLLPLLLLAVPETFMLVFPMAAVLGGLLGTQQMVQSSELVASQGLGMGSRMLLKPYLVLSLFVLSLSVANSHLLVPSVNHLQATVRLKMLEEARTRFLRTGQPPRIPPGSPGQSVWMAPDGEVHVMEVSPTGVQHMVAKGISYSIHPQSDGGHILDMRLVDLNGSVFQVQTGSVVNLHQESQDLRFRLPGIAKILTPTPLRYLKTSEIMRLKSPASVMELSRRFSLPFASVAFLLFGIAMGLGHPRFQAGGSILNSLGLILVYYFFNMLFENMIMQSNHQAFYYQLLLPWLFLAAGFLLLNKKLKPHMSNTTMSHFKLKMNKMLVSLAIKARGLLKSLKPIRSNAEASNEPCSNHIINRWACSLWAKSWGATLGTLLALDLLIEYATLAGDVSRNHKTIIDFLYYWILNLPTFMNTALPITFLLGTMFAFGQATQTAEWVALRAGGVSLVQWVWHARRAWLTVLASTAVLQLWVAPYAYYKADTVYRQIIDRPANPSSRNAWLYLGSTGVLWNQQGQTRWGFPLKPALEAPILLCWKTGDAFAQGLSWGGTKLVQGPGVERLFPETSLREPTHADMTSTGDLFKWQRWAPDPNRATLLWIRIFSWLAGPCLVLASLSWAFPEARSGRGQSIGIGLVIGLLFLGLQGIFTGASKSGEIPAPLGALAPMLFFAGFGFMRLKRLKT
ncbi:MAG: LptF/LptG family permease [Holophagaceae bacterium]|nr:LptF/LptG family permease [Holophagaceae bacterium]